MGQLISMYPIEVSVERLSNLTECLRLLELAELELSGPLAGALHEIRDPEQDQELVDNYRRVLKALNLTAPPAPVAALLGAAPEVTLNGPLHDDYQAFRDRFSRRERGRHVHARDAPGPAPLTRRCL